jgi:undecaprenyl-diphosphatase
MLTHHEHGPRGWLSRFTAWEHRLAIRFNRPNRRRFLSAFFGLVSRLGDGLFWYLLMAALLILEGVAALEPVLVMILTGIVGTLAYKGIKATTTRQRPCQRHPGIRLTTLPLDLYSFPSGHTLHAVGFTVVASAYYPALTPWLAGFALLVAASRLILGLHYLSDVLVGALIGGTIALAGLYLAGLVAGGGLP